MWRNGEKKPAKGEPPADTSREAMKMFLVKAKH
jgi:hypothetical protein